MSNISTLTLCLPKKVYKCKVTKLLESSLIIDLFKLLKLLEDYSFNISYINYSTE